MAFAILSLICCCLPGGIVAVIYASQVNGKIQIGDYAGAVSSANNAQTWCWISMVGGVLFALIAMAAQ
jgi:hypothetical protein